MNEYGVIYKIENLINGKVYIGQTIKKADRRFQLHKSRLKRNVHENAYLQNAWNKYGESSFVFVVIGIYNVSELDNEEIKLIKHYRELEKCYNLENGGNRQKKLHESTKEKLSMSIKNLHKNNQEYRNKYLKNRAKKSYMHQYWRSIR
ncbi:GIY-YIG nuclease family protein [Niallia circulans]|uniref:GIY-YIG nuclease family protein n=1 Tax=Niallia circulans TaxID=1397 RepID=UPI00148F86EF|nr:GIY-YIG nuclease family protein [Niallia circulans]QJX63048.1 GIY-YIG nuclease family protein [Niallia circulans]